MLFKPSYNAVLAAWGKCEQTMSSYYHDLEQLYEAWVNIEEHKYVPVFALQDELEGERFEWQLEEFCANHVMTKARAYELLHALAKERKPFWWKGK